MKKYIGESIKEGVDFVRVPSLTLTQTELDAIPEPPLFEDFKFNSNADDAASLADNQNKGILKNPKNLNRGNITKTLRFQRRLSSMIEENGRDSSQKPLKQDRILETKRYVPSMNKVAEEEYLKPQNDYTTKSFNVQISNPTQNSDLLYGDDVNEEQEIINKVSKNKTAESLRTANDLIIDEIFNSYTLDYMDIVENSYLNEKRFTLSFPPEKSAIGLNENVLLTPPTLHYHQHSNSIGSASDLSTLPEKLFSSPEIERRSCASSVYSEISFADDNMDSCEQETPLILGNYSSLSKPQDYDDDYIMRTPTANEWKQHKLKKIALSKPYVLPWDSEFESDDEVSHVARAVTLNKYHPFPHLTYLEHIEYRDDSSSQYSRRTLDTGSAYDTSDYYETVEHAGTLIEI